MLRQHKKWKETINIDVVFSLPSETVNEQVKNDTITYLKYFIQKAIDLGHFKEEEQEILRLILQGAKNSTIAETLGIDVKVVTKRKFNIKRRLQRLVIEEENLPQ